MTLHQSIAKLGNFDVNLQKPYQANVCDEWEEDFDELESSDNKNG